MLPPVAGGVVGVGQAEHAQQPRLAVASMIGHGLARPLAGYQDPPPGVTEVLGAVRFALARARAHAVARVLGLDAVPQPVRARRRARLVPQSVQQPGGVLLLPGRVGLVASGDVLGEVFGQVPDAPAGIFRSAEDALRVELGPEPRHMQRVIMRADPVQGLASGGQYLAGRRIKRGARSAPRLAPALRPPPWEARPSARRPYAARPLISQAHPAARHVREEPRPLRDHAFGLRAGQPGMILWTSPSTPAKAR